jgi:hypothetical protein
MVSNEYSAGKAGVEGRYVGERRPRRSHRMRVGLVS